MLDLQIGVKWGTGEEKSSRVWVSGLVIFLALGYPKGHIGFVPQSDGRAGAVLAMAHKKVVYVLLFSQFFLILLCAPLPLPIYLVCIALLIARRCGGSPDF